MPLFVVSSALVRPYGSFGCKNSGQIRTENPAENNAFRPNLSRVYDLTNYTDIYNLKALD